SAQTRWLSGRTRDAALGIRSTLQTWPEQTRPAPSVRSGFSRCRQLEHPATADFLGGYYFTARTINERSAVFGETRDDIAEIREEFGQASRCHRRRKKSVRPRSGSS